MVDGKVNITDGTIDGSKVTFTVVRGMNGTQITRKFSGMAASLHMSSSRRCSPPAPVCGAPEIVFKKQ